MLIGLAVIKINMYYLPCFIAHQSHNNYILTPKFHNRNKRYYSDIRFYWYTNKDKTIHFYLIVAKSDMILYMYVSISKFCDLIFWNGACFHSIMCYLRLWYEWLVNANDVVLVEVHGKNHVVHLSPQSRWQFTISFVILGSLGEVGHARLIHDFYQLFSVNMSRYNNEVNLTFVCL